MRRAGIGIGLLLVAALAYGATGLVVVAPGEAVVVRRLGRILPRAWTQGPHWGLSIGLDQRIRIRTDEVRRLEVGLGGVPGPDDEPGAGEFLTGDRNVLRARAVVQYRVADPVAFVVRAEGAERLLQRLAESALARAVARRGVDEALRASRAAIARDAEADLAAALGRDRLDLGVAILGLSLTDARPPTEVEPAFAAAQAARSERDRRLKEADTYVATARTLARAEADSRLAAAHASADRRVALARAAADRFLALLDQADRNRPLTVRRLYFESLRDLLPRVRRTVLLTPEEPVDLSILGTEP